MNPYVISVVCDVCGEPGVCRPRDAGAQWLGRTMSHSDPSVCAANLRWKREKEEAAKNNTPCPMI